VLQQRHLRRFGFGLIASPNQHNRRRNQKQNNGAPRSTERKKQEELSGQEPEEKTREEEGNFKPVVFREYHPNAETMLLLR